MKKTVVIIVLFLFCLVCGSQYSEANSLAIDNKIEGIRIDKNLKDDPNVHLKNLNLVSSRLYTIVDNDYNYYFCLNEALAYPEGNIFYEFDSKQVQNGSVVWLLKNFYTNQENNSSEVISFRNENFETQYAATQLAIWYFTNPDRYTGNREKIITENTVIKEIIAIGETHRNDPIQPYEELMQELEKVAINLSDIIPTGSEGNYYTFKSMIQDENITDSFFVSNESISVNLLIKHPEKTEDISSQSVISLNKDERTIDFKIPKNIIEENKDNAALLLKAEATIKSRNEFYLSHSPVGTSRYQPLGTKNTIEKNVIDIRSINIDDVVTFTVVKNWDDNENQDGIRPTEIFIQLYGNGQSIGSQKMLNASNDWSFSWINLPRKDEQGIEITYTVVEVTSISGYENTITEGNNELAFITNTHVPEVIDIEGEKIWEDGENQDGNRPEMITVHLLANGERLTSQDVLATNNWKYRFLNLPKYENGTEITYAVEEEPVAEYTSTIENFNITNKYTPKQKKMTVIKAWDDKNNQDGKRPTSIQVQLYGNEKAAGEKVTLNEGNHWQYTWTNLPEKEAGKDIAYTVKEVDVPSGYEITINNEDQGNLLITNTYKPELVSIKGTKTWVDNENQDGKRPDKIIVNLLADGQEIDQNEVTEATNWSYEFTNLPKYKAGKEIVYTVTEDNVPEYTTEITGTDITNRYTPGETSATVTKAWDDKNNQDGKRPTSIQVQLYGNEKAVGKKITLNEGNHWQYTWTNISEKEAGKNIAYTVKEVDIPSGYRVTVNNENPGNIIITNTITPLDPAKPNKPSSGTLLNTGEKVSVNFAIVGCVLIILPLIGIYIRRNQLGN